MDTDMVEQSGRSSVTDRHQGTQPVPEATEFAVDEVDLLLDEVEAALTRLDEGTYGVCAECGATIDDDRLSQVPTVMTCAPCGDGPSEDRTSPPTDEG
jgi:RNA polymerase-binding transcription factor DksA